MTSEPDVQQPNRLPRGTLDRKAVVAAALELADREGLAGVTMGRVAGALGTRPASLYRHLRDKQELLDAIVDLALSELPAIAHDRRSWRVRVEEFALEARRLALRHPALVEIGLQHHVYGPAATSIGSDAITLLQEAGFDVESSFLGFTALRNHVLGELAWEISRLRHGAAEFAPGIAGSVTRLDPEAQFVFGLGQLLDGFEAELRRARRR